MLIDSADRGPPAQAGRHAESQRLLLRARPADRRVPVREAVRQTDLGEGDRRRRTSGRHSGPSPRRRATTPIWPGVDGGHNWMSPSYSPAPSCCTFNAREERRRFFKTDAPEFRPGETYFGGGGGGGARFRPEESWGKLIAMEPETGEVKWEHRDPRATLGRRPVDGRQSGILGDPERKHLRGRRPHRQGTVAVQRRRSRVRQPRVPFLSREAADHDPDRRCADRIWAGVDADDMSDDLTVAAGAWPAAGSPWRNTCIRERRHRRRCFSFKHSRYFRYGC